MSRFAQCRSVRDSHSGVSFHEENVSSALLSLSRQLQHTGQLNESIAHATQRSQAVAVAYNAVSHVAHAAAVVAFIMCERGVWENRGNLSHIALGNVVELTVRLCVSGKW